MLALESAPEQSNDSAPFYRAIPSILNSSLGSKKTLDRALLNDMPTFTVGKRSNGEEGLRQNTENEQQVPIERTITSKGREHVHD